MAIGDSNNRFGTPATGAFGQPAQPQGSAFGTPVTPQGAGFGQPVAGQTAPAPAANRFAQPTAQPQPTANRFGAPAADSSGISQAQATAGAAQTQANSAAATAFASRFPGVKFTGTPDATKIAADAVIHPGATINFPDPKAGSITIASGVEIAGTATISTPQDGAAPGVVGARTFALGGAAALGSTPVAGSANAIAGNGPKSLVIDDCTIEGNVCAWRELVKTTVKDGGSIEGNAGRVEDVCVNGGGKIGGIANVKSTVVPSGTVIEGSVTITGLDLGGNCYIGGTGIIDDSTMQDGSRKDGPSSMTRSTLESGSHLANGTMIDSRLDQGATKTGPGTIKEEEVPKNTEDKR